MYNYVANNPINSIDIKGEKIKIVNGSDFRNVLLDLARVYATVRGRGIIDRLIQSKDVYEIKGITNSPYNSSYNRFSNRIKYYMGSAYVDGVDNMSFLFLAHELYHAYQDDIAKKYDSYDDRQRDAMRFENYVREVYGMNDFRIFSSGDKLLSRFDNRFSSFEEKIDLSSVSVDIQVTNFDGNWGLRAGDSQYVLQDRTKRNQHFLDVGYLLQYMSNNGLQKLTFYFY